MGQRLVEAPLVVVYHHAMWCQRCCFFVPVKGLTCALFKVYMADASPAAVGRHVSHRRDRGPLKRQHVDQQQHPPSIARSDCIVADAELRGSGSRDMDANLFAHLVCCCDDYGCDAILVAGARTCWQIGAGRRKTSTREARWWHHG
jgi:hypothetical protein